MQKVVINGKAIKVDGNNISVIGNKVYVDGKLIEDLDGIKSNNITIKVYGNVGHIDAPGDVSVEGNVDKVITGSGDIKVNGNVTGECKSSSGDITVSGNVDGPCTTSSGDITAKSINGSCKSMSGDISGYRSIPKVSDWMPK